MPDHRYARRSLSSKALRHFRQGGINQFLRRGWSFAAHRLLRALGPWIVATRKTRTFSWRGTTYTYFMHPHNLTWRNERAVEIPLAESYLSRHSGGRILEVGNVLSHYRKCGWEVIDKFEVAPGVLNEDIVAFRRPRTFDLILCISTLEHVGFDDDPQDPQRLQEALHVLQENLAPGGECIVTCPMGYNPWLDELIGAERLGASEESFLIRTDMTTWREGTREEALRTTFDQPLPAGNALYIGRFSPLAEASAHA